jgi:hypothetical protein
MLDTPTLQCNRVSFFRSAVVQNRQQIFKFASIGHAAPPVQRAKYQGIVDGYLGAYPNGRHAKNARASIAAFESLESKIWRRLGDRSGIAD